MIHLAALPGTPRAKLSFDVIRARAVQEAELLTRCGFDALLIENMHDRPYLKGAVGAEIVAHMTAIACAVRATTPLPCGIQVLAAANREALAIAAAAQLDFIRAEGFVFGHLADEGYIDGCAGDLLRYRKQIGAEQIHILADLKKKHSSHALTSDVNIAGTAQAAEYNLADGVIVTGAHTGEAADLADLASVREATELPLLVGSGVSANNLHSLASFADAVIVGSELKVDGYWGNPLDPDRCAALVAAANT